MKQLFTYKDYQSLSLAAANDMVAIIKNHPAPLICLATGDTPVLTYQFFCEQVIREKIDVSHCTFIGLDEWMGIAPQNPGSCHYFLHNHIFEPLHISASQIHLFNAFAIDIKEECRKMDELIASHNGIALMIAGVGMNGHIGFNEPGTSKNLQCHVIKLSATTTSVGQKYFEKTENLGFGITVGLSQVLAAQNLLLLANGSHKSKIVYEVLYGPVTENVPASLVRETGTTKIFIDEAAAS